MSHGHKQHHHETTGGDQQPASISGNIVDFFDKEDMLRRDFDNKRAHLLPFLKRAGLKEGQHVLELGCGFAPLLDFYLDAVGPTGSVTLTDPEARLADRLAPRLSGHPNARFLAGRAEDLLTSSSGSAGSPGGGGGYDLAVMVNVYHHLDDAEAALTAVRGLLKGGGAGRLVIFDFVHGTLNIFVSALASEAARAVQSRLSAILRPEASPMTGLCTTRLAANGFALRLSESYVMQDRLRSQLGDFYGEVFLPHLLRRVVKRGLATEEEAEDLLQRGLPALREQDPDAVLFSDVHVMLAADVM